MVKVLLGFVVAIVVTCWATCFAIAIGFAEIRQIDKAGQFGDTFGVVNALFTMATLIGAAIAVYLQHTELVESRARAATADAERHADDVERSFFLLLTMLREATSRVSTEDLGYRGTQVTGLRAFTLTYGKISMTLVSNDDENIHLKGCVDGCSHWLKTVELILNFVARVPTNRDYYLDVLESQFADDELKVLLGITILDSTWAAKMPRALSKSGFWERIKNIPVASDGRMGLLEKKIVSWQCS